MAFEKSDHFDGTRFFNPDHKAEPKGFLSILKWQIEGGKTSWPATVDNSVQPQIVNTVEENHAGVTFVNHATHLIQLHGLNILTDPVFSPRVSPFTWAGPKRVRKPAIEIANLPKIDVIVLSHNHYDHMDIASLKILHDKFKPLIVTPLGNRSTLESEGIDNVIEKDWWETHNISDQASITVVPAQHWSSRSLFDRNRALWGGFMIKVGGLKVYFAGDTGYGPHFKEIRKRLGAPDIGILPIGAYEPRWFMEEQHMNPEDAVLAHQDLECVQSIATHYGTFQLTNEGMNEPVEHLRETLKKKGLNPDSFRAPETGETVFYQRTTAAP